MDKHMLIQLWMANDFIASETRGQQIFDVLVWRCFLQDVEIQKKSLFELADEHIHRPTTCRMHDLMHDLAEFVSGEDCTIMNRSTKASSLRHKVRYLSVDNLYFYIWSDLEVILAPWPRTILLERMWCDTRWSIAKSTCMSLRALKTLSNYTQMTNLKHLRYLGNNDTENVQSCISPPPFFPKLETMEVVNMPNLERWHQEVAGQVAVESFPQLKELEIGDCPVLPTLE
ncbi:hypothetical protein CFC21_094954, partial [Triticum aestivum]|uniref:Disease resistance protein winged helix domain-containing protein n=2 Tax=Triticum aestivum TaxID=4565 RepID=A0A3B6R6C1_WHEAT